MKQKISISIEEEKIKLIEDLLKHGVFRNKSHLIEYSLDRFMESIVKEINSFPNKSITKKGINVIDYHKKLVESKHE